MTGIRMKYKVQKADDTPVDPEACYFVLRLDKDPAARSAMRTYAEHCDNTELAEDITRCLDWLDAPPPCICGGGRDAGIHCPFHDGHGVRGHPVWRHGG